jgi:hypothetical protein
MQSLGLAGAAAMILATTAQAAPVPSCVTQEEISGLVAYAMPQIADRVIRKCSTAVSPNGFFNSRGSQLVERLSVGKDAAWPMASRAFRKMGGEFKGKSRMSLSDATMRALIENELVDKMMNDLPMAMCRDIEAIAAPLEPLPAQNLVQFVSAIFSVAGRNGSSVKACPPDQVTQ